MFLSFRQRPWNTLSTYLFMDLRFGVLQEATNVFLLDVVFLYTVFWLAGGIVPLEKKSVSEVFL
jgi:hypothetical protein